MRKLLPNAKQMLHQQAHSRDTNPAAKPHKDRFSSGFHKLDDVGVQADCRHCHDNKEFAHLFQRACHRGRKVENGGNHGSKQKKQHKEGENLFQIDFCALCAMPFPAVRTNASTSVIGMIASVRVSLTIAAASSVLLPWIPSQACAAAVTEEVSLIAVPANRPKPHWTGQAARRALEKSAPQLH